MKIFSKGKWTLWIGWSFVIGVYTNVSRCVGFCFGPLAIVYDPHA